ncbi:sulfite exporter TauE/SafE family protein [Asanoa sp. NPDC050611]|uniref:sulfite exporter TauE/SafE family protein n=1 Tax=Asanoa sp. NPDC050611 TaxID=3157098 RepID=UPI003410E69E
MDLLHAVLLLAAGLAAGFMNAIAGGGSLITFPALLGVGLPAVPANVSNSVAVCPGYFAAVYGSRKELRGQERRTLLLLPVAVGGAIAGCVLLLITPEAAFDMVVPFLVLGATAVLAFQDQLRRVVGHPARISLTRQRAMLYGIVGVGSVYGGYFGAALGVLFVAGLALVLDENMARVTAVKNVLSATVGVTTVVVFALFGPVNWATVAVLAPAALVGGYVGARLARRLPSKVLKAVIVVFGTGIGLYLLVHAFV